MEFCEKTLEAKKVYTGKIIEVRVETVELPNGNKSSREIVSHPGAVAVVPNNEHGEVILVRQYRKPTNAVILEVPAGKLEADESSYACALRELKEETGLSAGKMEHLFDFYTTPGFFDEVMHLFLATELIQGKKQPDSDELLETIKLPLVDAISKAMAGELNDAKTLVGLFAAKKRLNEAGSIL